MPARYQQINETSCNARPAYILGQSCLPLPQCEFVVTPVTDIGPPWRQSFVPTTDIGIALSKVSHRDLAFHFHGGLGQSGIFSFETSKS